MSLLTAANLSKYYGAEEIFSDVCLEIGDGARIALVGANGAGKTTLIDILAGLELPSAGETRLAKRARMAYLPQRPELAGKHSLWEEQLKAFADLREMEGRLQELEGRLAEGDGVDEALSCYGRLQAEYEGRGGYSYETRIKMVLSGLGFTAEQYDRPLPELSGGQKTRALLGRLLLEEPLLLILDEPTNHLDMHAVEWLENHLKAFPGALLAVSHDRYFLDAIATTVWELEDGRLDMYRGNYSDYVRQRALRHESLRRGYERQQRFIEKERAFIRKHMGSRRTEQAKGRMKKLETMRRRGKMLDKAPRPRKRMVMDMDAHPRSGDQALMAKGLQIGYDSHSPLMGLPDILVLRGETVAIIGSNGVGKSTLLKTLAGDIPALQGSVKLGAKIRVGYFAQAHEKLNGENAILDEIIATKKMPISEARDFLGRFMFSGDDVFRLVSTLSGGERGRVALAKLNLLGANLLLLDEPTNHLDIDSQEALQAVLEGFSGAILMVSHDRYLVDALATQIWELRPGGMQVFAGDYQEYIRARNQGRAGAEKSASSKNGRPGRVPVAVTRASGLNPYEAAKRAAELEESIAKLEEDIHALSQQLGDASAAGDANAVRALGEAYAQSEAQLEAALEEWGEVAG